MFFVHDVEAEESIESDGDDIAVDSADMNSETLLADGSENLTSPAEHGCGS
jgi:hypothetical protein